MLSVIVYGRNDSHGYNLHKRAALSLNAIAHLLTDPDDEIIFVDYNTPDELPTFPETIADTLTDAARRRIRVLRVRPRFHAQFVERTKLVALEPQARNIAVRRVNPRNRWILSTNTDMVFVPHDEAATISSICTALADGFYHLPRFELPEGFWERADRADPAAMIEAMRLQGRRYHLNEIVYGRFDNIYEGPGDFQLFLREDLTAIGGFDERMILGWHVDTNIARRMRLLRGRVETAFPLLSGYHCGHTRQATSLHGAGRTENSLVTYADEIVSPYWTERMDLWGAPEEAFEEFRLSEDRTALYLGALDRGVAKSGPERSEAYYEEKSFCEQGFDADHVVPHLADMVFNFESGREVFMVASDRDLIEGFARFACGPPTNIKLSLCAEAAPAAVAGGAKIIGLEEGLASADVILLQFPNPRTIDSVIRQDQEWFVQHALDVLVAMERKKPYAQRRRVIVVNGTHNRLQDTVNDTLDAAAMPYSSRLRVGRVVDPLTPLYPVLTPSAADLAASEALGRSRSFGEGERAMLTRAIEGGPAWERLAAELVTLAQFPTWAVSALGVSEAQLEETRVRAQAHLAKAASRAAEAPAMVGPRVGVSSRLCSGADWEDAAWSALARRYFGERVYGLGERTRWLWERISLVYEATRRLPPRERPWVLIVADEPDVLAILLSHQGYRVAYTTPAGLLDGETECDWDAAVAHPSVVLPADRIPLSRIPKEVRFEALLAPGVVLFNHGDARRRALLRALAPRLAPDAHFGATVQVHLRKDMRGGGALTVSEFGAALDANGVLGELGLKGDATVDARIPSDTLVKYALADERHGGVPGLSYGFDEAVQVTVGMLWTRAPSGLDVSVAARRPKTADADADFVARLEQRVFVRPQLFAQRRRDLRAHIVTDQAVETTDGSVLLSGGDGARFAIFLGALSSGRHVVEFDSEGTLEPRDIAAQVIERALPGEVSRSGCGMRIAFDLAEPLDRASLVVTIKAQALKLFRLEAWTERAETAAVAP